MMDWSAAFVVTAAGEGWGAAIRVQRTDITRHHPVITIWAACIAVGVTCPAATFPILITGPIRFPAAFHSLIASQVIAATILV